MSEKPKSTSSPPQRELRKNRRRANPGRRRSPVTDVAKPLIEAEIRRLETQNNVTGLSSIECRRLLDNLRRLRQLLFDAQPHVPDDAATRALDLPARLKAEVERG